MQAGLGGAVARWALLWGLVMAVSACTTPGPVADTIGTAPPTTSTLATQAPTTTAAPDPSFPASSPVAAGTVPGAPWSANELSQEEVPKVLVTQWQNSEVKGFCSALYPGASVTPGAEVRGANFGGGWAVAWDLPEGKGRTPSGEYCEDCGRGAFGVAGAFGRADGGETEVWINQVSWPDGSKAGYGYEALGDGSLGEPHLMYLLIAGEGCLYNVWSFRGEIHLLRLVEDLRLVEGLRGSPTFWLNEQPPTVVRTLGRPSWVTEPPLDGTELSGLYATEWAEEAGAPGSCPMLAYASLGEEASDATIRRAENFGEMLLAWDRPSGPGHDGFGEPCAECGRGAVGLGTFQGVPLVGRQITHEWADGSEAAAAEGIYGTEIFVQPAGFDCTYWLWSHLGPDHADFLLTQLRRVSGFP